MKAEITRRQNCAAKLEALLTARPGEWISITELAAVGGVGGFRTRLSELTRRGTDPLHIEWNGFNGAKSAHRYLPNPLGGRAAETLTAYRPQPLFETHRPGWQE